jgi:hypothetical protein
MNTQPKKWWQSTNFWNNLVLLIGAGVVALGGAAFPENEATGMVGGVFALLAGGNILRTYFKNLNLQGKFGDLIKSPNFIASMLTLLVGIIPALPVEAIQDLTEAIQGGNLQAILIAAFNLVNILYHIIIKPRLAKPAA